ncbi:hypothetical protein B0H13DRAFT_1502257, partial [Mycena leptocephala]
VGVRRCVTFKRALSKTQLFGDESPAPSLGNLATHLRDHHRGVPPPSDVAPGEIRDVSASAAKLMDDFLVEGKLNPVINSTQGNFLKIFAAWIIEEDLPFTTGETPGIERLFAFLRTRYLLPSDTSVPAALDNASPNNVLMDTLSKLLMQKFDIQFVPENSQIRRLAHVVNLVVQKLLAALGEAQDPAVEDTYRATKDLLFHYNPDDD